VTAAQIIKPFLSDADRERPDLRITNTAVSCGELLRFALQKAGPAWALVGKTNKDGAQITPPGFTPFMFQTSRPDGQVEAVKVTGVSMDAAWYLPTMEQVKVIVNSSANDDTNPAIHGPATLTPYGIERVNYRWHNPPVAQTLDRLALAVMNTGTPQPTPPQPPSTVVLDKATAFARLTALNEFYASPEGLKRPGGMIIDGHVDMEAVAQWYHQMVVEGVSFDNVKQQIRQSAEWRSKHPGGQP